jgi:predicted small metal-binding protein
MLVLIGTSKPDLCHDNKEITMANKQYKKLGCLDVNPTGGCAFEVRAESEDEVMRIVGDHAKTVHQMSNPTPEMMAKVKGAIKSVSVDV